MSDGRFTKGNTPWNKGKHSVQAPRKWTKAQREALSKKFKGRKAPWTTKFNRSKRGITLSDEHKRKVAAGVRHARRTHAPVWNKGLSKETSAIVAALGRKCSATTKGVPRPHVSNRQGTRRFWYYGKDYRIKMRSRWEVAYAHYLDKIKVPWLYEAFTFVMDKFSYTPDFYIPWHNTFYEIKGFLDEACTMKCRTFVEHFGCELVIVDSRVMTSLGLLTAKGKVVMPHVR